MADKTSKQEKYKSSNKTWFGPECREYKKAYNKAHAKYIKHPSSENKLLFRSAGRKYKQIMNKHINIFNRKNEHKLLVLNTKRPKDYWKIY